METFNGSEYELKEIGIKFKGTETYEKVECVGSCEEEMESRTVTKKCRGIVKKTKTKGTGKGNLKISAHIPYAIYTEAYGMELDDLKEGIRAYGQNSVHKEFAMTQLVEDEDGNAKYKAYPNCVIQSGIVRKIENGAEEVAELELDVSVMPDDYGNGMYEAPASESTAITNWMTAFTPEMAQIAKA